MKAVLLKIEFAALVFAQFAGIVLFLAGCNSSSPVSAELRAEAERSVAEEIDSPTPLSFGSVWKLGGHSEGRLLCGEVSGLRYIYDGQGKHALVEPHRLVPLDGTAAGTLQLTRDNFDRTWEDRCEKSRPGWLERL